MGIFHGPNINAKIRSISGLYGKRYVGYYASVPSWFLTATLHGDTNTTTSINNFTSSADSYSWMWLGYFIPTTTETYTFYTSSDDASHLWVGTYATSGYTTGNCTVNNGGDHGTQEASGTAALTAGTIYPIRIMYGENAGADTMTVSFSTPTITKTTNGLGYYFGGDVAWTKFGTL